MPAAAATARQVRRPALGADELREALLARVRPAGERDGQDAEWEAGIAALEAAGAYRVPTEAELAGLAPDPLAGPPDGEHAWLADLPGPLLDEYLAGTAEPAGREPLPPGLWSHAGGDGAGFAAGGAGDDLAPGPVLAGLVADVRAGGLGQLSDDELLGVLRAGRRLASWSASVELAAAGDLMRRRLGQEAAGLAGAAEHADAEVAAALTLTGRAAGQLLDLAMVLDRLPMTSRALGTGVIDLPRARVIADEVAGLAEEHIAAVEERVLARAAGQTTTQVRAATRRAVIAADPAAARNRTEQAEREARVERWAETAGTGALAGRDLPAARALAADQHLTGLAGALREAGAAGTMDQLRAQVFVTLLTGQPISSLLPPGAAASPAGSGRPGQVGPAGVAGSPVGPGDSRQPGNPGQPSPAGIASSPDVPGSAGVAGSGGGPAVAGVVNLTVPLGTWLGLVESPGEVPGFGPLDAHDSRALARAMAAHPSTRWCLTITDETGRPVAHGCAPRRHPQLRGGTRGGKGAGRKSGPPGEGPGPPAGDGPPWSWGNTAAPGDELAWDARVAAWDARVAAWDARVAAWVAGVPVRWLEAGECAHRRESVSYRPPPALQHLIRVRQQMCVFPGCGRAARRCDLDHTIPYHRGGRTCECNLAPLCRKHHQTKQAQGWTLDQHEPGIMVWTAPSGRRYPARPTTYPS